MVSQMSSGKNVWACLRVSSADGRYYVRWCFADAALARAFADEFGT
jgi:hypothetical protein